MAPSTDPLQDVASSKAKSDIQDSSDVKPQSDKGIPKVYYEFAQAAALELQQQEAAEASDNLAGLPSLSATPSVAARILNTQASGPMLTSTRQNSMRISDALLKVPFEQLCHTGTEWTLSNLPVKIWRHVLVPLKQLYLPFMTAGMPTNYLMVRASAAATAAAAAAGILTPVQSIPIYVAACLHQCYSGLCHTEIVVTQEKKTQLHAGAVAFCCATGQPHAHHTLKLQTVG